MAKKSQKQPTPTIQLAQLVQDTTYALDSFANAGSDDLLNRLGLSRSQVYDAVMSDDEVDSCREDVVSALLASGWRLYGEQAKPEQLDKLYACIRKNLPAIAEQVVIAKLCGYSVARLVYRQDESGFVLLQRVISRHDELDNYTPKFDRVVYKGKNGEETIDTQFTHLFLANKATSKNPAGEMAVVRIYPAVRLRKEGWRYAYQFAQRYAQPYLVAKTAGSREEAARHADDFKQGGAAAIGTDEDIVMLQNSANGEFFRQLEQQANARIQKAILGRVKTSELLSGSRAAQQVEQDSQSDRIDAYLNLLATAVQHLVDTLQMLNQSYGEPINGNLWFEYYSEIKVDVQRAERDAKYLATGQVSLTKDYYTQILGFEPEHIALTNNQATPSDSALNVKLSGSLNAPATQSASLSADQAIMRPKIDAILAALQSAESYAEFADKLAGLDLNANDQMLIDKLTLGSCTAFADGFASKGGQHG